MTSKAVNHLQTITVNDEWYTPKELFYNACRVYKTDPQLDVCARYRYALCPNFYSPEDDGLSREWRYDFFLNPPYSKAKEWIKHAYEQHLKHNITGMALVYAKTDTKWFHEYINDKAEIHFIKGRIKFIDPVTDMRSKNSAPYPSMWVIWRKRNC